MTDETENPVINVPSWIARYPDVTFGARICWMVLKSHDKGGGVVWVSRKKVANDLGVSDRSVTNYFAELTTAGMIEHCRTLTLHSDGSEEWSYTLGGEFTTRTTDEITLAWDGPLNAQPRVPLTTPDPCADCAQGISAGAWTDLDLGICRQCPAGAVPGPRQSSRR